MRNNYSYSLYQVLLGCMNKKGKKGKAKKVLDSAFQKVADTFEMAPSRVLKDLIAKLGSTIDVKVLRVRKNIHIVPFGLKMYRAEYLFVKRILDSASEDGTNRSFSKKLGDEIINILQDKSCKSTTRYKQMLKQAAMNRANSHFRW